MAEAVEAVWGPCEGLVITRYGYGRPCQGIKIVQAAHPVPDAAGAAATAEMLALLGGLGEGDFVLALISGGASALLVAPVDGVSLAEKQAVNAALLALLQFQIIVLLLGFDLRGHAVKPFRRALRPRQGHVSDGPADAAIAVLERM